MNPIVINYLEINEKNRVLEEFLDFGVFTEFFCCLCVLLRKFVSILQVEPNKNRSTF